MTVHDSTHEFAAMTGTATRASRRGARIIRLASHGDRARRAARLPEGARRANVGLTRTIF
jgi:hypothetical protein